MNWHVIHDGNCVKYLPIEGTPTGSRVLADEIAGLTKRKAVKVLEAMYSYVKAFPSGVIICRNEEMNDDG